MRRLIIAGNWKMNKNLREAVDLAASLKKELSQIRTIDIVLCPPATNLLSVHEIIKDSQIELGAQNLFWEKSGAYTGEISAEMLKSVGCHYVIIGHSERRQYFGETNDTVNKKMQCAIENGLVPIMCIGEVLEQREAGITNQVLEEQVRGGLKNLSTGDMKKVIIAYEPVWAIGTGKTATSMQAQEAHSVIRNLVRAMYNDDIANNLRIQYGGSVKPENAGSLLSQPDVDGALVGGASLDVKSFKGIIEANL